MGKGSAERPGVRSERYRDQYDMIDWGSPEDPPEGKSKTYAEKVESFKKNVDKPS